MLQQRYNMPGGEPQSRRHGFENMGWTSEASPSQRTIKGMRASRHIVLPSELRQLSRGAAPGWDPWAGSRGVAPGGGQRAKLPGIFLKNRSLRCYFCSLH